MPEVRRVDIGGHEQFWEVTTARVKEQEQWVVLLQIFEIDVRPEIGRGWTGARSLNNSQQMVESVGHGDAYLGAIFAV